jgi:O-antigen ligase
VQKATLEEKGPIRLGERIDIFCARAILFIFLFILVWGPLAYGAKFPGGFLVIQAATIVALVLWLVRFWVQRPFRLLWPPVCWGVVAFLLYAIVRCHLVEVEYAGRQQLIHVLVYGVLFFLALNNLNRKLSASLVSLTLIGVGFVLALLAVFQFASHFQFIWGVPTLEMYKGRGSGTFMNPNHLAAFLGMTVPLALAYTVMGRLSATVRVLLAYGAVVMLAGIAVSVSRGGIVTAVITLLVFCGALLVQRDFWKSALVILCILTALGAGAASQFDSIHKRFDQLFDHEPLQDERAFYWEGAWQLFRQAPVWGIGPGHFDVRYPSVRAWRVQDRPEYAHNDYLNTLCDWGVVGMVLVAAVCGLLWWGVFLVWRSVRKPSHEMGSRFSDRSAFVVGAAIALLAVMLHCIVEFNMQRPALAITAVTLMALLAAQARFATERYWRNPGGLGKILLTVTSAALIGYLSVQGLRKGAETYWLARVNAANSIADAADWGDLIDPLLTRWLASSNAANTPPESVIALFTKAHEAEPMNWQTDYLLGEYLWQLSLQDGPDYLDRARQALSWYSKAMELNPFDGYAPIGCGMCLDRIGPPQEATPYFRTAIQNDPHNCYVALEVGRHCIALGELAAAKRWLRNGAQRWASTEVATAEANHLDELMADPLYVASASLMNTNKPQERQGEAGDPLLEGPK